MMMPLPSADRQEGSSPCCPGVNRAIHVTFDDALYTDAEKFVTEILPALGVRLCCRIDFAFGRGRGGDIDTINALGADIRHYYHTVSLLAMTTVRCLLDPCALPCRKGTRTRRRHAGMTEPSPVLFRG